MKNIFLQYKQIIMNPQKACKEDCFYYKENIFIYFVLLEVFALYVFFKNSQMPLEFLYSFLVMLFVLIVEILSIYVYALSMRFLFNVKNRNKISKVKDLLFSILPYYVLSTFGGFLIFLFAPVAMRSILRFIVEIWLHFNFYLLYTIRFQGTQKRSMILCLLSFMILSIQ